MLGDDDRGGEVGGQLAEQAGQQGGSAGAGAEDDEVGAAGFREAFVFEREPALFKEVQKDIDGARVMMTESRD